jgi:hypothetical protein
MEGLNSGEVSRYVKQLKYLYGVPIKEETASYVMGDGDSAMGPVPVEKTPEVMALLEEEKRSIRGELGRQVGSQLRIVPEIDFHLDTTLDYAEHIEELLKK